MKEFDEFEGTREVMAKAVRQLNTLEYMMLGAAFLFALLGGGLVAFVLSAGTDLPFRLTWAVLSLGLLAIPGAIVLGRERLRERKQGSRDRSGEGPNGPPGPHETNT